MTGSKDHWRLLGAVWVLIAAVPAFSQTQSLEEIQNAYRSEVKEVHARLDLLNQQYRKALEKLESQVQKAGNLELVLKLREELTRHESSETPPPKEEISDYAALADLQRNYRRSYAERKLDFERQLEEVKSDYEERLSVGVKELAKAGRQDEAARFFSAFGEIDTPTGGGPVPFREALEFEEFRARFASARARLKLGEVKKDLRSPYGLIVKSVDNGGVAERLRIQRGDRIVQVGDLLCWSEHLDWKHEEPARILVWETADGIEKSAEIGPGKIGVNLETDRYPHRYYLSSGKRSATWDDLILTALLQAETDPKLAETAINQAIDSGYVADGISSAVGILISLSENRPEDAVKFARHILDEFGQDASKIPLALFPVFCRACLAGGQLDLLEQADREFGGGLSRLSEDRWPELMRAWKSARPDWNPAGRPSERVDAMDHEDVFKLRKVATDFASSSVGNFPRKRSGSEVYTVDPERYVYAMHFVEGGIENCVWEMEFSAEQNPVKVDALFQPMVSLTLLHHLKGAKQPLANAKFFKSIGSQYRMDFSGAQQAQFRPSFHSPWDGGEEVKVARVRVIRLGNEVEIQVNGATQLWLPLDPQVPVQDLLFRVQVVGMVVDFKATRLWRIR